MYNDRFTLVSVHVRVNRQHNGFITPVAAVGILWWLAADTRTSHLGTATAHLGCPWCDRPHVALKGLYMVNKTGVGEQWISQKWLNNYTNKQMIATQIVLQKEMRKIWAVLNYRVVILHLRKVECNENPAGNVFLLYHIYYMDKCTVLSSSLSL